MDMFLLVCASNTGGMCTAAPISGADRKRAAPELPMPQVQAGPGEFGFGMWSADTCCRARRRCQAWVGLDSGIGWGSSPRALAVHYEHRVGYTP